MSEIYYLDYGEQVKKKVKGVITYKYNYVMIDGIYLLGKDGGRIHKEQIIITED